MAQVDMTNARLTPLKPYISSYGYLDFNNSGFYVRNESYEFIASSTSVTVLSVTLTKVLLEISITFNKSGTQFFIYTTDRSGGSTTRGNSWKVDNISFSSGDTCIFRIEAENMNPTSTGIVDPDNQ